MFDGYRAALAANRAQLYLDIPTGPFYGFNRPGAKVSEGLIRGSLPASNSPSPSSTYCESTNSRNSTWLASRSDRMVAVVVVSAGLAIFGPIPNDVVRQL